LSAPACNALRLGTALSSFNAVVYLTYAGCNGAISGGKAIIADDGPCADWVDNPNPFRRFDLANVVSHGTVEHALSLRLQRQRQLHADLATQLTFDEILQAVGYRQVEPANVMFQLAGDVLGGVARPSLMGIEGNDAQNLIVLSGKQVSYSCWVVGPFRRSPGRRHHP